MSESTQTKKQHKPGEVVLLSMLVEKLDDIHGLCEGVAKQYYKGRLSSSLPIDDVVHVGGTAQEVAKMLHQFLTPSKPTKGERS